MDAMKATSWSGSEDQRREQGGCAASPIASNAHVSPYDRSREIVHPKRSRYRKPYIPKPPRKPFIRETVVCQECGPGLISRKHQRFSNGTVHIKVTCGQCGRYIKWEAG